MTVSNLKREEAWINAWSELAEAAARLHNPNYLLPDWTESTAEGVKEWIQNEAYEGWTTTIAMVFYKGRQSLQCNRGNRIEH